MFQENKKAYIALLTGAIIIGFSPVLIKMADAPGIVSSFYRLFVGTIVLTPFFIYSYLKNKPQLPAKGVLIAVFAGLCFALDMSLWTTGIMVSTATIPTIAGNLSPLWVGIMAMFFFKERNKAGFWIGLLMALVGVSLLVLHDFYHPNGMMRGLLLGLVAGVVYAIYIILTQPGRKYLNTLSFLYITTLATTFFLGIFLISRGLSFTGYPAKSWIIFIIMGITLQAGAWFLINYSQGHLPASIISPTLLTQPVLAAIFAFFMIGEVLTIWQMMGGLIVVAGIYLVHFSRIRKMN
ncbi:MAG: DMT family transporter [Salinivirgaceae bacterium]|nr:DMT family transporter [Salinivirgaceae bacterium]